jgi:hypothetical protein
LVKISIYYLQRFAFELQQNKKIDFIENLLYVKISVFPLLFRIFPDPYEHYWKLFTFDPPKYQLDLFLFSKGLKSKIKAQLLLQNVMTDITIINKHTS